MKPVFQIVLLIICILHACRVVAQPCQDAPSKIYGERGRGEHGQCLVTTPENDGVYVAANKEDSTLLIKIDLNGNRVWSRVIDAIPDEHEVPAGILVDSDGMIAVSGTARNPVNGGTMYAFRLDPYNHQMLWAREYSHSPRDFNHDIEEKGNGGNYLVVGQATFNGGTYNDASIAEIDRNTGALVPEFQQNYHLNGTETLYELLYYNDYLYGAARYKDNGPLALEMRHTLCKLDPANGQQVWVKMGHQPATTNARLYGTDLLVDNDQLISLYFGDPDAHTTNQTEVYIQRTDLDGNLMWLKHYNIPGDNSFSYDIIKSGNGYVTYTTEVSTGEYHLFKIDQAGEVIWARRLVFHAGADIFYGQRGNPLLVEAGNQLVMTGAVVNTSGDADLFIIMTDLEGNVMTPCITSEPILIQAEAVVNPVFYNVLPDELYADTSSFALQPLVINRAIFPLEECQSGDTIFSEISTSICTGASFEGYTTTGVYVDTLVTATGCDSIRTLLLTVYPPLLTFINAAACEGETFLGYGVTGMYTDTFQTIDGCDSVRTLHLTIYPGITTAIDITICDGESMEGYSINGIYTDTFVSVQDCDSTRTLHLTVLPVIMTSATISICEGSSYEGHTASGMYVDTFIAVSGCDSVHTLFLTVTNATHSTVNHTICLGDSHEGYHATGMYPDTFQSSDGCDSIRILHLTVEPVTSQLDISICEGDFFEQYTMPGVYIDTLPAFAGVCDTVRTLNLQVISAVQATRSAAICAGESLEGYTQSGVFVDTLIAVTGCDSIRTLALEVALPVVNVVQSNACAADNPLSLPEGIYVDTLETIHGCDSIRTLIIEGSSVYVPNVFSPNHDGINDTWSIAPFPDNSPELIYLAVFDRLGNMAYETVEWPVLWKGDDANGKSYQPGVFAYLFVYRCGNVKNAEHGNITLIR